MAWPYSNITDVATIEGNTEGIPEFTHTLPSGQTGRSWLLGVNMPGCDEPSGWSRLVDNHNVSGSMTESDGFTLLYRQSNPAGGSVTCTGVQTELVDGWAAIFMSLDGAIDQAESLTDVPGETFSSSAHTSVGMNTQILFLVGKSSPSSEAVTTEPLTERLARVAGTAHNESIEAWARRCGETASSVTFTSSHLFYGTCSIRADLRYPGRTIRRIDYR